MSDDIEIDSDWDPQPVKPDIESMLKHASSVSPYREDPREKERLALAIPAKIRTFECPNCGITKNVKAAYSGQEWHYSGQCSHCGTTWVNAYHLMRECQTCGKKVALTSKNPQGRCSCEGEARRPFSS